MPFFIKIFGRFSLKKIGKTANFGTTFVSIVCLTMLRMICIICTELDGLCCQVPTFAVLLPAKIRCLQPALRC